MSFRISGRSNRRLVSLDPRNKKVVKQILSQGKPTVKSLDKRIKKINKQAELKHIDTFNNGTVIPAAGLIFPLNLSVQGNTDITRDGDDTMGTSIQWRIRYIGDDDRLAETVIRFILAWDRQPNGVLSTFAQLLDNSVITSLVHAPYNHNFQERFKILHDSTHVLKSNVLLDFDVATGTTTTNQPPTLFFRGKRQLSRTVKYNGNAGTIADIETNSLVAFFVSSAPAAEPTLLSGFRFYFKDM